MLVGRDTLVRGPYPEFVRMAANFEVSKDQTRHFARVLIQEMKKSTALEGANTELLNTNATLEKMNKDLRTESADDKQNLIDCGKKVASLKPWATVGKVGVVVVSVAVVGIVAAQVVQATTP